MRCPSCDEEIAERSRFCPACGTRLSGHGEERRVVSVLFADVVGFTSLAEHRDPEQVKHLVDRCFQWLVEDIVSFGGRVDKIIGDAVLALFGAPVAHEDDAERAVRAALRMQQTMASRSEELEGIVRLRIGVNTGEVLVGALHAGGDYTAMGDVVNTANRLQGAAEPGEVLVGETTRLATERVVSYEPRGVVEAKGRQEPVLAWPGDRPNGSTGPIVGRAAEVAALTSVADTALSHGRASLLVLLGDAGMGKSRVSAEVIESLAASKELTILQGRCVPYGEVNAWWPIAEALRAMMSLDQSQGLEVIHESLAAQVAAALGVDSDDPEVVRTTHGLVQLFGFEASRQDLDPDHTREEIIRSVVTFLDTSATRQPVVIRLSDMHWADPAVLDMLVTVMSSLARRPVVLITTARRSLLERWRPPIGRFDTFALNLEALDTAATDELIDMLLSHAGDAPIGEATRAELRERSGGNPLFLVELMSLLDESRARVASDQSMLDGMPDTLRGLVAARLDNLDPAERTVIDDASVLGRRGLVRHLQEMAAVRGDGPVDDAVAELDARDLFRMDGESWEFRSDLTREVAYRMLTKSDRADKHLGIARWIEQHHVSDRTDRTVDLLAHHYGQAAELLADLGSVDQVSAAVRERALHWISEVSGRGERLRLLPAVERLCTQGLALADDRAPEVRLALLLRRARIRVMARDRTGAREDAAAARALAIETDNASGVAAVLVIEGDLAQHAGDLDAAQSILDSAVRQFEAAGDQSGRAEALRARGMAELFAGQTAKAEETTGAARDAFRALGRRTGEAWALQNLAWMAFAQGREHDAEARIGESLEIFEALGDAAGASWAQGLLGYVRLQAGDLDAAAELYTKVLSDSRAGGDRWATAMMLMLGAMVQLWMGRTESAVASAREGLELFRAVHDRYGEVRIVWPLARAMVMRGMPGGVEEMLDDLHRSIDSAASDDHVQLTLVRASCDVHMGRPTQALHHLAWLTEMVAAAEVAGDEAQAQLLEAAALPGGIEALTLMGMAHLQNGDAERAVELFGVAESLSGDGQSGVAVSAASVFGHLVAGDSEAVVASVDVVRSADHTTYVDRMMASLAFGLHHARAGDEAAAERAFTTARAAVDSTGDLLSQAIVRLGEARAAGVLGKPDAAARVAAARSRLSGLGVEGTGWSRVFDLGLGDDRGDLGE